MSKNELESLLESYIPGTGEDWKQSILDAMVAAYNRALDDAVEQLMDHDGEVASWQIPDELNKLKI